MQVKLMLRRAVMLVSTALLLIGCAGQATPPPTATATSTPVPTATETPTPVPTDTPTPTRTPTRTPRPTNTPTLTPTDTPVPTEPPAEQSPTPEKAQVPAPPPPPPPAGDNLLVNPSFEEPTEDHTPHGIFPHGWRANNCDTAIVPCNYPFWIHSGAGNMAMYPDVCTWVVAQQDVYNVVPGTTYRFGVWGKVWSSSGQDRTVSVDPRPVTIWICISTLGSQHGIQDPGNVCSAHVSPYDTWQYLTVDAVAQEEYIVVSLVAYHTPKEPGMAIWDDASLTVAPVVATQTPPPTAPVEAARPAPVPFDANALYDSMLRARSDMEQIGGMLDRLIRQGNESCESYMNWYTELVTSPVYDGVPADWGGPYGDYIWAVEHALEKCDPLTTLCQGEGGAVTGLNYGVARIGINESMARIGPAIDTAAALLGR